MSVTQAMCLSFKKEILEGIHDLTTDVLKIALYTSDATLNEDTTAYSATNEVSGTGYSAGGATLTTTAPSISSGVVVVDFADVTWSAATITARAALIYNSSKSDRAVCVLDFGSDKTKTAADFVVTFPEANATDAIIRIT